MTACQCAGCLASRLQGIGSLLARGRTAMAADALGTVVAELQALAAQQHARKPTIPSSSARKAARLAQLLERRPDLRAVAAAALKIRPHDLDAIATGRVLLTSQRWARVFAALEPAEHATSAVFPHPSE
ncbi:hypothetical protein [Geminicoccus flavidas]|uniref:hypothetical protein n=1 Tax=Geminicoccus flavidas TaxID=2506407 RepID=UPI00135C0FEC|nr:hypothetical protein [Geminicoccus flavidas]